MNAKHLTHKNYWLIRLLPARYQEAAANSN